MRKKVLVGLGVSFGTVLILVAALFGYAAIRHHNGDLFGVSQVKITKSSTGEHTLVVDYFSIYGYQVETVDADAKIIKGEQEVYEEGLGKYRVAIWFSDTSATSSLKEKYPPNQVHTLENVPADCEGKYRIWLTRPPDDSAYLMYIGTDEPIVFEEQAFTKTGDLVKGSVKLDLEEQ